MNIITQCTLKTMGCCALKEIANMSACNHPGEVLGIVAGNLSGVKNYPHRGAHASLGLPGGSRPPLILFTAIVKMGETNRNHVYKFNKIDKKVAVVTEIGYEKDFINYIEKHDLGEISAGPVKANPCYGNTVATYFWAPNYPKFVAWIKDHVVAEHPKATEGNLYPQPTIKTFNLEEGEARV